jgi:PhzF family phenazine biosynthesis protein
MPEPGIYVVDAFCDAPFTGNPAAVCMMFEPRGADWMQNLAAEMNLSETAFIWPSSEQFFNLRWFTPTVEVDLCGHATLASAKAILQAGICDPEKPIVFHTRSGELTAISDKADPDFIWLDFPTKFCEPVHLPSGLLQSLHIPVEAVRYIGRNQFDYLLEVADESIVRGLVPDFNSMMQVKARGLIVTAQADPMNTKRYDFVSRFFAPQSGINEDPVTGSAHCALAPFWGDRLQRNELTGYQASKRGGFVRVLRQADRVKLGGRAMIITEGTLSKAAWGV